MRSFSYYMGTLWFYTDSDIHILFLIGLSKNLCHFRIQTISLLSGNFAFLCEIVYYSHTADHLINQSSLSTWNFYLGIHVTFYLTSVQRTNCKSKSIKNWRKKLKSLFHGQTSSNTKQGIQELLVAYESIHVGIKLAENEVYVFFRHWHGAFGQYPLKVCHAHLACARAVVLLETSSQVLPVLE